MFVFIRSRRAFTLLELLIVIAIIAVLSVILIIVLNPIEQLAQGRDVSRISDLNTLKTTLGVFLINSGGSMGSPSVAYISIPDPSATSTAGDQCQGVTGLPSLPGGWTYHCAASSTYSNVDGTGWIPVNLTALVGSSPISALPIDPTNAVSANLYYTYQTNGSQYELTAALESQKYQAKMFSDGGKYSDLYEFGTKLSLAPFDYTQGSSSSSIALVQTTGALQCGITVCNVQFPANTIAGDTIIVGSGSKPSTTTVASVVDGSNDTFLAAASASNTVITGSIWYALNIAGGTKSVTTTISGSSFNGQSLIAAEFSGVTAFDVANASAGNSTGLISGTSTTNFATELIVGVGGTPNNIGETFTPGTGFAKVASSSADRIFEEYQAVGSTGAYSAPATTNPSTNWFMDLATFH